MMVNFRKVATLATSNLKNLTKAQEVNKNSKNKVN